MIDPVWALSLATATIAAGDWCNRHAVGWLPDDPPRPGRKQHGQPIPLAGVTLLPGILLWQLAAQQWLAAAACLLAASTGWIDDRRKEHGRDLGWRSKAIALTVASALGASALWAPGTTASAWLLQLGFLFLVTNATNFLDNTNGVAAVLAAVGLLQLGGPPWAIAAGCTALAFVPWNWPRPRLFLGDSGAYLLGMALGIASAGQAARGATAVACAAVALPLVDFLQVVCARLWIGHPPWVGDRRHLTHIAQNLGAPAASIAPLAAALVLSAALGARLLDGTAWFGP